MNLSSLAIERPIATTLLALGIGLFGALAFRLLPVSPLPQIEFPTISVSASLPGASPETIATSMATPLERQLGHIAGVTEITSSSKQGTLRITVQFDLNRNINGAARDVQAAIIAVKGDLPSNLPNQPTYRIVNPADAPIMVVALTSKVYTRGEMYDVASSILEQKISQVDGVGQVTVGESSLPAIRVELNPDALNQYDLSLEKVSNILKATNVTLPQGQLRDSQRVFDITSNDQIFSVKDYESQILTYKNGADIQLMDVGTVVESVEDINNAGMADGKPSVLLIISKQPGSNIVETVDRLYHALADIKASIPPAINLTVIMDRTTTIKASLRDVEGTLVLSIFLVIAVIYMFLGNAQAAFIPSIVVPLTILGTFALMYLCQYSLDNLSLIALTISTGFIVDDAVVVLENIERRIESGIAPFKAALIGAKEVSFTVLSMSTSLIAVFIPILMMGGIVGRLFREFAVVLSMTILVSMIISLTVTPMMASRLLKPQTYSKKTKSIRIFKRIERLYPKTLAWALRHQPFMLGLTAATILINVILFILIPKSFFPLQDTGRLVCSIQSQQDMSFSELQRKLTDFMTIIQKDSAVDHVAGYAGGKNAIGNSGSLFISLKPLDQRSETAFQVIDRLRTKLSTISGAKLYMQAAQEIVIGGRSNNAMYQYTLSSYDLETLNTWMPKIETAIGTIPGITDLSNDQLKDGLQMYLTYDRDKAARLHISAEQIDETLNNAFGQRQISTLYKAMNQYHVVMELAPKYWQHPDILQRIYITSSTGQTVPLSELATFTPSTTLVQINHQGQFPAATLSFNLKPGTSLGDVVKQIDQKVETIHMPKATIQGTFQGTAQAFQKSLASQPYLILGALIVVYIVLGILYESTIHPLTILSTLPSAGIGASLALMMVRLDLNILGLIGIILLIGIVKKNAIMMIDFALDIQRRRHKSPVEAIYRACLLRLRPILMTTLAAIFGALPLALASGVGAELRNPLGVAIIGGLVFSQVITLFTTPVIYLLLEKGSQALKAFFQKFPQV